MAFHGVLLPNQNTSYSIIEYAICQDDKVGMCLDGLLIFHEQKLRCYRERTKMQQLFLILSASFIVIWRHLKESLNLFVFIKMERKAKLSLGYKVNPSSSSVVISFSYGTL